MNSNDNEALTLNAPKNRMPVRCDEATRWKPGQSGNPGGRPKRTPLIDAFREVLSKPVPGDMRGRTYAQAISEKLATKAVEGDIRAAQELADRAEGKARQTLQIENTTLKQAFERMSDAELEAYAHDGRLPDWFPQTGGRNDEPIR
jgi:hypothetical protein